MANTKFLKSQGFLKKKSENFTIKLKRNFKESFKQCSRNFKLQIFKLPGMSFRITRKD